jgi:hypothetical protein
VQNNLLSAPDSLQIRAFTVWKAFQKRILCAFKESQIWIWIAQKANQKKHLHEVASKWAERSSK